MSSEETESLTASCSNTKSQRGSEDRGSETESVSIESVNSQKPPNKFHSDVWGYFKKNASGKKVQCRLCKHEYAYLGTASNLRDHLICYHKDKYGMSYKKVCEMIATVRNSFLSTFIAKC